MRKGELKPRLLDNSTLKLEVLRDDEKVNLTPGLGVEKDRRTTSSQNFMTVPPGDRRYEPKGTTNQQKSKSN